MDVIRAYSVGIKNVVATMGTAVTKQQANLIKRMAKEVILCFDGDNAGGKATMSCSGELSSIGVIPKIVRLENKLDHEDNIQKYGKDKFIQKIENQISITDFKLSYLKENKDLSNQEEHSNYIHQMLDELSKIDDEILIELALTKLSEESKIDIDFLKKQLGNLKKQENIKVIPKKEPTKKSTKYETAQKNLLYYMLNSEEVINIFNKKAIYLPNENYRRLARRINDFYKKNNYINIADIFTELTGDEICNILQEIMSLKLKEEYSDDEIYDYINTIYEYNIKFETNRLQEQLKSTELINGLI